MLCRRRRLYFATLLALLFLGCNRAQRYGPVPVRNKTPQPPANVKRTPNLRYGWIQTDPRPDIPLVFVDAATQRKEWDGLDEYWNPVPHPMLGMRTIHFRQSPFGAAASMFAAHQIEVIKLKVPLGLPDPTPYIPASNPPTYAKWRLGQKLFFDESWLVADQPIACATCHVPDHAFGSASKPADPRKMDVPSLINCVYNEHQFWDGRVKFLEQVVQEELEDEFEIDEVSAKLPHYVRHSWGGIIPRLNRQQRFVDSFEMAFGIGRPTTDAVAKALATYMRTILSGDSLYDRAKQAAETKGKELSAEHFEPFLKEKLLKRLERKMEKPADVADELARGHQIFLDSGCQQCHSGWNFSDGSFHNLGIRESPKPLVESGIQTGRFKRLPYGLKDATTIGAFRTPSLRALPRTDPYFHDGSGATLDDVIDYYNDRISGVSNAYLDPILRDDSPDEARQLNLTAQEFRALVLFLRSLDGSRLPDDLLPPNKE